MGCACGRTQVVRDGTVNASEGGKARDFVSVPARSRQATATPTKVEPRKDTEPSKDTESVMRSPEPTITNITAPVANATISEKRPPENLAENKSDRKPTKKEDTTKQPSENAERPVLAPVKLQEEKPVLAAMPAESVSKSAPAQDPEQQFDVMVKDSLQALYARAIALEQS